MYRLLIHLLFSGLIFITGNSASSQTICDSDNPNHPVDKLLLILNDSLTSAGTDSIIMYRHWINSNGFNGYGKIIWKKAGKLYGMELDYHKSNPPIITRKHLKIETDSLMNFFFDKKLDLDTENPTNRNIRMSHDGIHVIKIKWNDKASCFMIYDTMVVANPDHPLVQWINRFKKPGTNSIEVDIKISH